MDIYLCRHKERRLPQDVDESQTVFFFTPCSRRGGNSGLFNLRNAQIIDEELGTFVTYLKATKNTFKKSGETMNYSGVTWLAYPKILKFEVFAVDGFKCDLITCL